jgi:hypothetical protein
VRRLKTDLRQAIDDKRIPVVNVIGSGTEADGLQRSFPVGHYLTVVGYEGDGDKVKLADPWQPVGDVTYWIMVDGLGNRAASRGYSAWPVGDRQSSAPSQCWALLCRQAEPC